MESSTTSKRAVEAGTLAEAFRLTAGQREGDVAVRTRGDETSWTWGDLRERVDRLAGGLVKLGLQRGEAMAIMLSNRPEFHQADLAAMMVGATPFSIYMQYTPDQIEFVVGDAGARIIITEQQFLPNVLKAREKLPGLEHVIVVDGEAPEGVTPLEDVADDGFDVDASVASIEPHDVLTLIYTSGTTGPPKGVQLSHRNIMTTVMGVEELIQLPPDGRVVSWLPSAHIAERNAHHYIPIVFGLTVTTCDNPRDVLQYLPEIHPSWFFAVPRIWEKLKSGLETMLASDEDARKAVELGREKVRLEQAGEPVPDDLAAAVAKADEAYFAPWRRMLGLDEVLAINVGAAPTPVEVLEFFHAIGLPLAELWGMSETCGAGAVNPPDRIKIGTVGPAAPHVELKLDTDGELLIRSDVVMLGYRNLPDKTKEAFTDDGFLRTGDIAEIDEDGYVKLVDRKKELIINAAGKNMSPANIEATVKSASPLIGQVAVIGDGRSYNTALIVLDADFAPAFAAKLTDPPVDDTSLESLAHDERVRAGVQQGVDAANEKLARVEQIKKFVIVEGDWLPGGDELTPTMKLKRRPIAEKYSDQIEGMYAK